MTAIPRRQTMPRHVAASPRALLALIQTTLDDGKAEEVVTIDLTGKSSIADFLVIASGRSQRQVVALAEKLRSALVEGRKARAPAEGLAQGDWVLVDAGDIVVHIFRPEVRAYYNLEKMWGTHLGSPAGEDSARPDGASLTA